MASLRFWDPFLKQQQSAVFVAAAAVVVVAAAAIRLPSAQWERREGCRRLLPPPPLALLPPRRKPSPRPLPRLPPIFFCLNTCFFIKKIFPFDYERLTGVSSSIMVFAEGLLLPFPSPSSSKASSSSLPSWPSAAAASEANRTPSLDLPDPAKKDIFNFYSKTYCYFINLVPSRLGLFLDLVEEDGAVVTAEEDSAIAAGPSVTSASSLSCCCCCSLFRLWCRLGRRVCRSCCTCTEMNLKI